MFNDDDLGRAMNESALRKKNEDLEKRVEVLERHIKLLYRRAPGEIVKELK